MELEALHPLQIERFRLMSFREKMAISQGLFRMAQRARREALLKARPGLENDTYDRLLAKEFAGSRT